MVEVRIAVAVLVVALLSGCQTAGSFCSVMTDEQTGGPILTLTQDDAVVVSGQTSRGFREGLVTVLETGEKQCGWRTR